MNQRAVDGAVNFVGNALVNAGIGWLLFRDLAVVPLWGARSAGVDLMATGLVLPPLAGLIVAAATRKKLSLPKRPIGKHLLVLTMVGLLAGAVLGGAFHLAQVQQLTLTAFVTAKALLAGALGALVGYQIDQAARLGA